MDEKPFMHDLLDYGEQNGGSPPEGAPMGRGPEGAPMGRGPQGVPMGKGPEGAPMRKGPGGPPPEAGLSIRPDFDRWRGVLFRIDSAFFVLVLLMECIIVGILSLTGQSGESATNIWLQYLVIPSGCNLVILLVALMLRKRLPREDLRQNVLPILAMVALCFVVSVVHCDVFAALNVYCIPICMTTIFTDNKMLERLIPIAGIIGITTATVKHCLAVAGSGEMIKVIFEGSISACILILLSIVSHVLLLMTLGQKEKLFILVRKSTESMQRAEAANRAKSTFLANMSHEIRTPINAILGMNEMILRESENEQITEYASNIHSASLSLLYLVNDVLDFSKIESDKLEIMEVAYDTSSLIHDCCNMISERAEKKGLSLTVECNPTVPSKLSGDEVRLRQIITNLLSNAVKYTEKGSVRFIVDGRREKNEFSLIISVADTGIGIKEENLKDIFTQFARFDMKRNRNIEGSGLGLSITGRLIDLMYGDIQVQSTYGEGSTFTVTIPQKIIDPAPVGDFLKHYRDILQGNGKYRQRFEAPEARILVVDDIEINLKVFVNLIKKTRVQVDTAMSGKECLALVNRRKYDIIFLDHMMPEMSGIETLNEMQKQDNPFNRNTPVIMLTANAIAGVKEQYLRLGFADYLSKPVSGDKLEKMILKYLPDGLVNTDIEDEPETDDTVSKEELGRLAMPEVDVAAAVERQGGVEIFLELLDLFYTSGQQKIGLLEELYQKKDYANYVIEVHGLKSAAANIGAVALSEFAQQHEKAGKVGDHAYIEKNIDALLANYGNLLAEIERVLTQEGYGQFAKKDVESLLPIQEQEMVERIAGIYHQVEEFQSKEAAQELEGLLGYALPEDVRTSLENVQKMLKMYEDEKAEDLLSELLEHLQG